MNMKQVSKRFIFDSLLVVILLLAGFYFRDDVRSFVRMQHDRLFPCSSPITYSIGQFSPGFGITKAEFLQSIQQAEDIWEKPLGKQLFVYVPENDGEARIAEATSTSLWSVIGRFKHQASSTGDLEVNLIYDYRQQVTSKLQTLDSSLKVDKGSYAAENAKYLGLSSSYKAQKAAYESQIASYKVRKDAYAEKVSSANASGGASPEEYRKLKQEAASLDSLASSIRSAEASLNALVNQVNAEASILNQMAQKLNMKVTAYNTIGASTGREFEEGEYVTDMDGRRINIFQFNDRNKLVRVLAHELGHALGLEHVDDPQAIMYRLNEGTNKVTTATDLNELRDACNIAH